MKRCIQPEAFKCLSHSNIDSDSRLQTADSRLQTAHCTTVCPHFELAILFDVYQYSKRTLYRYQKKCYCAMKYCTGTRYDTYTAYYTDEPEEIWPARYWGTWPGHPTYVHRDRLSQTKAGGGDGTYSYAGAITEYLVPGTR